MTMVFFCTDLEVGTRCGNNCLPSGLYSTKLSAYIRHTYKKNDKALQLNRLKYLLRRKKRRRGTGAMQDCPTKHPVPGSQVEKVHVSRKGRPALRIVPGWCHHTVVPVMQDRPPFHLQVRSSQVKTTTTSTSAQREVRMLQLT